MTDIMMLPTAAIEQAKNCYQLKRKLITPRTKPADFVSAKILINDNLSRFNLLADSAIEAAHTDHTDTATQYKNIAAKDIVISALSDDFMEKYSDEIRTTNDSESLFQLLEDIIGTLSDKQIQSNAEDELTNLSRDIENDEKFERFHKRIKRLALKASSESTIQNHLITKTFNRNLTPTIRNFLHEREKGNMATEATAKYLDQMFKHKKTASVNNIENPEASARMIELQKQNRDLHEKMDSMQRLLATLLENQTSQQNSDLQIHQIKEKAPQNTKPFNLNDQRPRQNYKKTPDQQQQRYINPNWELNKYGAPYTCRKCGIRGHRDQNCRGTRLTCHLCNQEGHIKYACPQRQNQTKMMPKNLRKTILCALKYCQPNQLTFSTRLI